MMTYACTSIPLACASLIKSCSGSKPAASGTKSGAGSRELRYQESPRRRTCAKIAFALAALALFTTATMSSWLLSVVLKVTTQQALYWLTRCADALTEANDSPVKSRVERQTIQNGWPPGMRPGLVRFRKVVPPDAPRRWYILGQRIVQLNYDPGGGQCKGEFGSGQPDDRNSGTLYFPVVLTLTRSFYHSILSPPVPAQP